MQQPPCAIEIVNLSRDGLPTLLKTNLESIVNTIDNDIPIAIISVCGAHRIGKSFLLGMMIRYLTNVQNNGVFPNNNSFEWAKQAGDSIQGSTNNNDHSGFQWKKGVDGHTHGIWMWSHPFVVKQTNGSRIAILLLDTQGLFDVKKDPKHNVNIFAASTILSSLQIFNVDGNLQQDQVDNLTIFAEESNINASDDAPFQSLNILQRNYSNHDYNRSPTQNQRNVNEHFEQSLKSVLVKLHTSFKSVRAFALPDPGNNMKKMNTAIVLNDIDEDFQLYLTHYMHQVINNIEPKQITGLTLSKSELLECIHRQIELLHKQSAAAAANETEAISKEIILQRAFTLYQDRMKNTWEGGCTKEVLLENHKFAKKESQTLVSRARLSNDMKEKLGDNLQNLIQTEFQNIQRYNDQALKNKQLQEELNASRERERHAREQSAHYRPSVLESIDWGGFVSQAIVGFAAQALEQKISSYTFGTPCEVGNFPPQQDSPRRSRTTE